MFCINCGKELKDNTKFCPKCGNKVENEELVNKNQEITNIQNEENKGKIVDTKNIIDYFKRIISLETRKYALLKVINTLNNEKIEAKSHKEKEYGYEFNKKSFFSYVIWPTIRNTILNFIFGTIIWYVIYERVISITGITVKDFEKHPLIPFIFLGLILIIWISVPLVSFIKYFKRRSKLNKKIKDSKNKYTKEIDEYNKSVDAFNATLDNQRNTLIEKKDYANNMLKETEKLLKDLYDLNIVHKKYQNFVAVATICEYFETCRCNSFDGYTGAYNIYEQEIRQEKIISRLDAILYSLEDIKRNQFTMYCAIQNGNNLANQLLSATSQLSNNTNIIKENTDTIRFLEKYRY